MNISFPSVTQEEDDPSTDFPSDTKRVTFSDNVTVRDFDNPHGTVVNVIVVVVVLFFFLLTLIEAPR